MAIKLNIGKLPLQGNFEDIEPQLIAAGITILPLTFADTVQFRYLPLHHRDPFDRILVAQAINHSLVLISRDVAFDAYDLQRVWL
jgi:PIN domain nuclease of toxin-antitoxin system